MSYQNALDYLTGWSCYTWLCQFVPSLWGQDGAPIYYLGYLPHPLNVILSKTKGTLAIGELLSDNAPPPV